MSRQVGQWTIGERVGGGGQGRVYLAASGEGHEQKAIKLIEPRPGEHRLSNQKRRRFVREVRQHLILSDKGAANIVPILDHNLDEFEAGNTETGFIVMPLAKGTLETFKNILVSRVELVMEVYVQILNGVAQAHEIGVIHRDVKPANILFYDESLRDPQLTDFGICFVKEDERLTRTEETVGAQFFMAPEQEGGRQQDVDVRVDIYALGKLLHYMLSGRLLPREELDKAFREEERSADNRVREIEEQILGKTIVFEPDRRFATVEELKRAAERILNRPRGGPGMVAATPAPVPAVSVDRVARARSADVPRETEPEVNMVKEAFDAALKLLTSGDDMSLALELDKFTEDFRDSWVELRPQIENEPNKAPEAARKMTADIIRQSGVVLAVARGNAVEMFDGFKRMLESMLQTSKDESGYVAITSVPRVPAGFLYMTACVGALRWRSWEFLTRLLNDKFEWYYQSGRPLFSFGFGLEYFFHAEAFGRRASKIHDFYREFLSQPQFLKTLGINADGLFTVYVQAQLMHCLRAAQEIERGNREAIWPDFGRFNDYRVLQLLDRVWQDSEFADKFCRVFKESPENWKNNLNNRLTLIREEWFTGSEYIWGSVRSYEPR